MIDIKDIDEVDFERVINIIHEFAIYSPYNLICNIDKDYMINSISEINKLNRICKIAICEEKTIGVIAGVNHPSLYCEELWNQEFCWYVNPNYRGGVGSKLLKEYEKTCNDLGVKKIQLSAMRNNLHSKLDEFLKNKEYINHESSYVKVL